MKPTFARQPSLLPIASFLRAEIMDGETEAAYLNDGPCATRREADGSGEITVLVDGARRIVALPAGTTWIEVEALDDDAELAAHAEAGPPEIEGAEVAQAVTAARVQLRVAARPEILRAVEAWSAEHRVRLTVAPDPADADLDEADQRRATEVRIKAARAALVDIVHRSVHWPAIAGRAELLERLVDAAAPDDPLARAVRDLLAGVPRGVSATALAADAAAALRRYQAYDRRLAAAIARRGLVRVHHPEMEGLDRDGAWRMIEGAARQVRDPLIAEIYAHVTRLGDVAPKAAPPR